MQWEILMGNATYMIPLAEPVELAEPEAEEMAPELREDAPLEAPDEVEAAEEVVEDAAAAMANAPDWPRTSLTLLRKRKHFKFLMKERVGSAVSLPDWNSDKRVATPA
jgi:hypothetical protein